jgi:hypothetical protein
MRGALRELPQTEDIHGKWVVPIEAGALQRRAEFLNKLVNGFIATVWSGRCDSNTRPPAPKAGALPGCATPRHFCASLILNHFPNFRYRQATLIGRYSLQPSQNFSPTFFVSPPALVQLIPRCESAREASIPPSALYAAFTSSVSSPVWQARNPVSIARPFPSPALRRPDARPSHTPAPATNGRPPATGRRPPAP